MYNSTEFWRHFGERSFEGEEAYGTRFDETLATLNHSRYNHPLLRPSISNSPRNTYLSPYHGLSALNSNSQPFITFPQLQSW